MEMRNFFCFCWLPARKEKTMSALTVTLNELHRSIVGQIFEVTFDVSHYSHFFERLASCLPRSSLGTKEWWKTYHWLTDARFDYTVWILGNPECLRSVADRFDITKSVHFVFIAEYVERLPRICPVCLSSFLQVKEKKKWNNDLRKNGDFLVFWGLSMDVIFQSKDRGKTQNST